MADLKHVGRHAKSRKKCVVAYRVVPHAPDYCLVVNSETLDAEQHDSLMKLVESSTGQSAYELAEAMQRTRLPDGRNMLQTFHTQGKLTKTLTSDIEMVPNQKTSINLAELNDMIAKNRGVTVADLALGITSQQQKAAQAASEPADEPVADEPIADPAAAYSDDILTDDKLAAQYRSQADALYKEAKALRDQADKLDPPKKKTTATSKTTKTPARSKKATSND